MTYGDGRSAPVLAQQYLDYTSLMYEEENHLPRIYDRFFSGIKHVKITVCDIGYLHNLYMIYIVDSKTYTNTRYTEEYK